jgi:holo-[acyl-carrier protein] synthase
MIKGIGIDIIEIARVRQAVRRYGDAFLGRIFTPDELNYCRRQKAFKYPELAVRFAAKEAYAKAVGTGIVPSKGLGWKDIAVASLPGGQPCLLIRKKRNAKVRVSLSHSRAYAVASVYVEK